jgi:MFS family permease
LCIGLFLSFLDGSITATALYTIGIEFNALTSITWIAVAYTLADVGFATLFTALADIIGRFNAYLLAQTMFLAFSFACGFAQSLTQLIVFRVLQGIGGSGLYSLAMVIWPEMSTYELKKWIGAFVGLVVAAAGVAGPLLGGVITNDIS